MELPITQQPTCIAPSISVNSVVADVIFMAELNGLRARHSWKRLKAKRIIVQTETH